MSHVTAVAVLVVVLILVVLALTAPVPPTIPELREPDDDRPYDWKVDGL